MGLVLEESFVYLELSYERIVSYRLVLLISGVSIKVILSYEGSKPKQMRPYWVRSLFLVTSKNGISSMSQRILFEVLSRSNHTNTILRSVFNDVTRKSNSNSCLILAIHIPIALTHRLFQTILLLECPVSETVTYALLWKWSLNTS